MGASSACCEQEQCQPPCVEVEAGSEPGAQLKNVAPALRSPGTTEAETFDENASQSLETVSENSNNSSFKKVLTVRTGLMRGIALKETLRRGGRLWRTSPMDLPEQEKASLWSRSRPVSHFDVFISHTWSTRGCWKYLSLSFQYGWAHILLTWLVAVMLVELLFCLDLLPPCTTVRMYFQGFDAECPFGGWALYVASPLAMLAFFVAPYCPDLCGEKQSSFLDVVSINQCDKKMMQEGIYGLGGFLSASKELRILYSPSYFSRLWCLFELGAFRKANPAGRIWLAPLFVEVGLAIFWMGGSASILLLLLFINRTGAKILPAFVPLVLVFHTIRKSLTKKRQLLSDLENFEVTAALCRKTSDRDFVYGAIEEWYGGLDAFSEYVRGPLREELLADHSGSNLPPHYALLIMTPWISLGLDALVAQARAGAPMHCLLSYGFGVTLGLFTCWGVVMLQFGMFLCDRYPLPKASIWAVAQSLSLFVLFLGTCFAGITVGTWAYKHSVTASMIWFVVTLLLALLCNYGSKAKACVGRVKKQAPADMREAPKAAVHADWLEV